ncbi:Fic family protein [Kineococcus sp. TBRC 1896]|uniref:Fic family protein n=1 Tax=Kineococcus mangrovi TaxID=1660183 RepID=A0ABV4I4U2_9ACTN
MATDGWVAIGHEDRPWTSRVPADLVSRRVRESHAGGYRAAVLPPITDLEPVLPLALLVHAERAAGLIARFDAESEGTPVPSSALLRSESASSSQVENTTSGARALAVAAIDAQEAPRDAGLVLGNVRATERAMHHDLLAESAPDRAGRWRQEQVWIGGSGYGPHQAEFVPPHHEAVPAALEDLVAFAARRDVPVLVHAALVHAQFETAHPFVDGNGRTGRALVHVLLRRRGLVRHTVVPVSAGLLREADRYVDAAKALATLTDAGSSWSFSGRRRGRRWQAPEVISALDEFARRAGRRS